MASRVILEPLTINSEQKIKYSGFKYGGQPKVGGDPMEKETQKRTPPRPPRLQAHWVRSLRSKLKAAGGTGSEEGRYRKEAATVLG